MTDQNELKKIQEHNKHYLQLNDAQYEQHRKLMATQRHEWPDSLVEYVTDEFERLGLYDVVIEPPLLEDWIIVTLVANWIRRQDV